MLVPILALSVSAAGEYDYYTTDLWNETLGRNFYNYTRGYYAAAYANKDADVSYSLASIAIRKLYEYADSLNFKQIYTDTSSILFGAKNQVSGEQPSVVAFGDYFWEGLDCNTSYAVNLGYGYWSALSLTRGEPATATRDHAFGYGDMIIEKPGIADGGYMRVILQNNRDCGGGFVDTDLETVVFVYEPDTYSADIADNSGDDYREIWVFSHREMHMTDGSVFTIGGEACHTFAAGFHKTSFVNAPDYVLNAIFGVSKTSQLRLDRTAYARLYHYAYGIGDQNGYADGRNDGYDVGYNEGFTAGDAYGNETGYREGYENGSYDGYEEGRSDGYDIGYNVSKDEIYTEGYNDGSAVGYSKGYTKAENELKAPEKVTDMVIGIFEAPVKLIDGMLGFEIFGINVASFLKVTLTLAITAAIVWFILKISKG